MYGWRMPMAWIIWIPVAILMIWLIIKLSNDARQQLEKRESPLEILKRRFANGEIDRAEFEERKKTLETN